MGFTGPSLSPVYLGKLLLSVTYREGSLLPAGGGLTPHTPLCYGPWHMYMWREKCRI